MENTLKYLQYMNGLKGLDLNSKQLYVQLYDESFELFVSNS